MFIREFSDAACEGSKYDAGTGVQTMDEDFGKAMGLDREPDREMENATRLLMSLNNGSSWPVRVNDSEPRFSSDPDPLFSFAEGAAESEHFQEQHVPSTPPSSKHFAFAPTTLYLEGCVPQQIVKHVVDFLTSQVVASVTKVRPQKYSIKAEVFIEAVSCTIKVRVYNHQGKYAVEVQRRSGDIFVLQSTYRLLEAFLENHCGRVSGMRSAPLAQPLLPDLEPTREDPQVPSVDVLAPVLTMTRIASLQAQAATVLVALVKGGRASADPLFLAPDQVAAALADLLASDCLDTVYPAARCVSILAAFGEADSILARHGLLQKMALQAVAELKTAKGLVGTALARAVGDAVQCCAESLTSAAVRDLQQVLDDAMNDEMLRGNVVARTHLEQAGLDTKLLVA